MDVTIRLATVEDAAAIATAHVRAWQAAYRGIVSQSFLDGIEIDARIELWRRILNGEIAVDGIDTPTNYAAVIGTAVIGFANVGQDRDTPADPTRGQLWAMYVHPDHWGSGAGFALMNQTITHFQGAGVRHACLWVFEENERARRFYERQGWRADDVTRIDEIDSKDVVERRYSIEL